jgi:hypothetical protein
LNLPMSARSFSSGRTPASESFVALIKTMNRIVVSPFSFVSSFRALYCLVERAEGRSTRLICATLIDESVSNEPITSQDSAQSRVRSSKPVADFLTKP